MIPKNGGTAFPAKVSVNRSTGDLQPHQFGNHDFCTEGMTLRDYFAAKAMSGWLASFPADCANPNFRDLAQFSYSVADAMLKAREPQP